MRQPFRLAPLAAVAVLLLAGFVPAQGADNPGKITVEFWDKWSGFEADAMQSVVDDFNKAQDKIFVRRLNVSRIEQKMMLATAGRVPPDIVNLWASNLTSYVQNNALLPLDKLAREAGVDESAYIPMFWQLCHQEGFLWALPLTPSVTALHWNKKMFREAGLDPEKPPRTLEELEEFNNILTKREPDGSLKQVGHLVQEPGWWMRDMTHLFGGSVWDGGSKLLLDEQPSRDFFAWIATYPQRFGGDAMNRLRGAFGNFASPQNPFFQGRVAMIMQGVWMDNFIRQYASPDFEYGVAPFPIAGAPAEAPATIADTDILVIPAGATHPREAMEFMAYVQTQPAMEKLCLAQKKFTPLREVSPDFIRNHPHPYIRTFIDLANSPNARPILALPTLTEYSNDLNNYVNLLMLGKITTDEARQTMQERQQKALDKKTARWNRAKAKLLAGWRSSL